MKTCPRCGERKTLDCFYKNRAQRSGVGTYCIPCTRTYKRDAYRAGGRYYRAEYYRGWHLKKKYGITLEDFERMNVEQGGRCKICRRTSPRPLVVDHNHATGEVRGLLCEACNFGIGAFGEDPERLEQAIEYLKMFNGVPGGNIPTSLG